MLTHIVFLLIGLAIILLGCELFTNGLSGWGKSLIWVETAVGSLLAAVGTALPEPWCRLLPFSSPPKLNKPPVTKWGLEPSWCSLYVKHPCFLHHWLQCLLFSWRKRRSREMDITSIVYAEISLSFSLSTQAQFLPPF